MEIVSIARRDTWILQIFFLQKTPKNHELLSFHKISSQKNHITHRVEAFPRSIFLRLLPSETEMNVEKSSSNDELRLVRRQRGNWCRFDDVLRNGSFTTSSRHDGNLSSERDFTFAEGREKRKTRREGDKNKSLRLTIWRGTFTKRCNFVVKNSWV